MTLPKTVPPWLFGLVPWTMFVLGMGRSVAREGPVTDFGLVAFTALGVVMGALTVALWNLSRSEASRRGR